MERTSRHRGPFVCPGDDEDDGPPRPGIIEQIDRVRRGLDAVPATGILAQIAEKTGKAAPSPVGGVLGQIAAAKERYREPVVWPRDWDDPGRNHYVSPGVVRGIIYGADRHPLQTAMAGRIARLFSGPGYIEHRGTWRFVALTSEVIIGPEDNLRRIAQDLTGNAADYIAIFPRVYHGVTLVVGQRIPLRMIQGVYLRWSKETWEAAVVDMRWEGYLAIVDPVRVGPLPTAGQIAKAAEKGWELRGVVAIAKRDTTLDDLAEAITGDRADSKLLTFRGAPGAVKAGDKVDFTPLLVKRPRAPVSGAVSPEFVRKLSEFVAEWEGRRKKAYLDTEGIWTVGVGYNLIARKEEFKKLLPGVSYDDLIAGKIDLTDEQIDFLFAYNISEAIRKGKAWLPNFDEQPEIVRLIVVDMVHNMGSLDKWPRFREALIRKDYLWAAREMNEPGYVKTKRRALHHIQAMQELGEKARENSRDR